MGRRGVVGDRLPRIRRHLPAAERGAADAVMGPDISQRGLRAGLLARLEDDARRRLPAGMSALSHDCVDLAAAQRASVTPTA